jgi:RimJ/RimL family protein N-acetyltransferase
VSTLSGRRVRLIPFEPGYATFAYELLASPELAPRWRGRGVVPTFSRFCNELDETFCSFVIIDRPSTRPIGLASAYDANLRDGIASLAVAIEAAHQQSGAGVESGLLLMSYLFASWPFRKLYGHSPEYNFEQFAAGRNQFFAEEARLRNHDYYNGRYWDLVIWSLTRQRWEQDLRPILL